MHKLTSKRQVTIPASVCDALNLKPGDYVEIFERDGVAHIVRMSNASLAGSLAHLNKKKDVKSARESAKQRVAEKYQ